MTLPQEISSIAEAYVSDGQLFEELKRLVSYRTESATASGRIALKAYLEDVLVPALAELGCDTELHPHWNGGANCF